MVQVILAKYTEKKALGSSSGFCCICLACINLWEFDSYFNLILLQCQKPKNFKILDGGGSNHTRSWMKRLSHHGCYLSWKKSALPACITPQQWPQAVLFFFSFSEVLLFGFLTFICVHACGHIWAKVREQFWEIGSAPAPCYIKLGNKHLQWLSHLNSPFLFFFFFGRGRVSLYLILAQNSLCQAAVSLRQPSHMGLPNARIPGMCHH